MIRKTNVFFYMYYFASAKCTSAIGPLINGNKTTNKVYRLLFFSRIVFRLMKLMVAVFKSQFHSSTEMIRNHRRNVRGQKVLLDFICGIRIVLQSSKSLGDH